MTGSNDPMEAKMRSALTAARVAFVEGDNNDARLDFYLPDYDIYIEVKQFYSDRISAQMARADNVIVAQGSAAVSCLATLFRSERLHAIEGSE